MAGQSSDVASALKRQDDLMQTLDQQTGQFITALSGMLPQDRPATLPEITATINYTWQVENWYKSFSVTAEKLRDQFQLPTVRDRLNVLISDIQSARAQYIDTYKATIAAMKAANDIQEQLRKDILSTETDILTQQMEVFQRLTGDLVRSQESSY